MCASCGCGKLNDDHGDKRHITMEDIENAAEAADLSVGEVVENIEAAGAPQGVASGRLDEDAG
jgi:hypothetical protein